jgi:SNF2 family DNA or RNA helicase
MRRSDDEYEMDNWSKPVTKLLALQDMCKREIHESGSRFIVFCQFVDEMNLIKEMLVEDGHHVEMYYGGLSQKQRTEVLKAGADVLLIQLQAGGVGLNLQEYDRVVFMSPWWTSALLDQAIARTVRMGQKKVVRVSFLMLEEEESENIDSLMMDKAETKRELLEDVFSSAYSV